MNTTTPTKSVKAKARPAPRAAAPTRTVSDRSADPLAARCFVTFADSPDLKVERQGVILGRVEPGFYAIQFFEWMLGEASTLAIVPLADLTSRLGHDRKPGGVVLFEDAEHMRFWLDHGPGRNLRG